MGVRINRIALSEVTTLRQLPGLLCAGAPVVETSPCANTGERGTVIVYWPAIELPVDRLAHALIFDIPDLPPAEVQTGTDEAMYVGARIGYERYKWLAEGNPLDKEDCCAFAAACVVAYKGKKGGQRECVSFAEAKQILLEDPCYWDRLGEHEDDLSMPAYWEGLQAKYIAALRQRAAAGPLHVAWNSGMITGITGGTQLLLNAPIGRQIALSWIAERGGVSLPLGGDSRRLALNLIRCCAEEVARAAGEHKLPPAGLAE